MNAASSIVIVAAAPLSARATEIAERLGAKVLRASDLDLHLEHLHHALINPMPVRPTSLVSPRAEQCIDEPSAEDLAGEIELMTDGAR